MLEDYLKKLGESAAGDIRFGDRDVLHAVMRVFAENCSKYERISKELLPVFEESFNYVRFPVRMANYFNEKVESLHYDEPRDYFIGLISRRLAESYNNMNNNMIRVLQVITTPNIIRSRPENLDLRIIEKKFLRQDFEYVERCNVMKYMLISEQHFTEIFLQSAETTRDKYWGLYNAYAERKALEREQEEMEKNLGD